MAGDDLIYFVLAVAVECGPLDGRSHVTGLLFCTFAAGGGGPVEQKLFAAVTNSKATTYCNLDIRRELL